MINDIHLDGKSLIEPTQVLVIREGAALPLKEPTPVRFTGIIDTPFRWLKIRVEKLDQLLCNAKVDMEQMEITLTLDEKDHYQDKIVGKLVEHPIFTSFGINKGRYTTPHEMAKFFKMHRSFFENTSQAMTLVHELQNFKAKVDKQIEKSDNNRGDKRLLVAQAVESNLPERFNLVIPLFKGQTSQLVEVEIYVNADDLCCTLISPQANDIIETTKRTIIGEVVDNMKEIAPNIVIVEI